MTPRLRRVSVSMPLDLVRQLDRMVAAKHRSNRSRAVAEMVRAHLVEYNAESDSHLIAGTVTLVYDHHKRGLQQTLTNLQHNHDDLIVSALHVHLDHSNCMEVLAIRGPAGKVRGFADQVLATKGLKHGKLTVTTTGREFGE